VAGGLSRGGDTHENRVDNVDDCRLEVRERAGYPAQVRYGHGSVRVDERQYDSPGLMLDDARNRWPRCRCNDEHLVSSFKQAGNSVMEPGDNAVDARMPCFGDQSDSHRLQLGWDAGTAADAGSGSIPSGPDGKGRHRAKGRMTRASIRSR
jgi:hypothetical protein